MTGRALISQMRVPEIDRDSGSQRADLYIRWLLEAGWSVMEAAAAAGISDRTARRWTKRWREEGELGLLDRSSAPHRIPHKTPPARVREIVRLRRLRMTAAQIALALGMALSTVSRGSSRPSRRTATSAAARAS